MHAYSLVCFNVSDEPKNRLMILFMVYLKKSLIIKITTADLAVKINKTLYTEVTLLFYNL